MSVTVYFYSGKQQTFDADAATLDGALFRLGRWNSTRQVFEEVALFPADIVMAAAGNVH
jgi:hypothetical protein